MASAELALQAARRLRICACTEHVERGDRLVGDDQLRLERQRGRDADALALAARELVRARCGMTWGEARRGRRSRTTMRVALARACRRVGVERLAMVRRTGQRGSSEL